MTQILTLSSGPKPVFAGLLGNVLDHFDTALYGFLAPFIAPLIFPDSSPLVQLIKAYSLMSLSILTRPLGAWFFGYLGSRHGARLALAYSLTGLALVTCSMGFIPSHAHVGDLAPLLLALLRLLQGFFAAGENTIAPFFILEQKQQNKRGLTDSIYASSTVLGELLASLFALIVSMSSHPEQMWRLPFVFSSLTACIGIYLRLKMPATNDGLLLSNKTGNAVKLIFSNKTAFLKIIIVSGLSYATYSIPFIFFINFIPEITTITFNQMIQVNTSLLAMDMLIFPVFGWLSDRLHCARFMALMAGLLTILCVPLFLLLEGSTLFLVSAIRIVIVLIGVGFNAPLHAWFITEHPGPERYMLVGLGYAIGSEIFGRSAPAICLLLWHATNSVVGPAAYI